MNKIQLSKKQLEDIIQKGGWSISAEEATEELKRRADHWMAKFKPFENGFWIRQDHQNVSLIKTLSYDSTESGIPFEKLNIHIYEGDALGHNVSMSHDEDVLDDRMTEYYFEYFKPTDEATWNEWIKRFGEIYKTAKVVFNR